MNVPGTARGLWRRHWPLLTSVGVALAAAAWLLTPPASRVDGAEQIWAAEAPFVQQPARTEAEPAPLPPLSPIGPPPEPVLPAEDLLEPPPEPAVPARATEDATHDLPLSLPPDAIEAWPPPPVGDLLLDEGEPQW